MLFNSYDFIFLFLPITLYVFYYFSYSGKFRAATWFLGLASLFFYAYWDWRFLLLFVSSIIFNYMVGRQINHALKARFKKIYLVFGLIANISLLAYFKYYNFFLENYAVVTGRHLDIQEMVLPIGISFFTFTQIAYLVDSMKRQQYQYQFSDYLLFVSFFPHLVAGPILMHDKTISQFESKKFGQPSPRKIYMAILFFSVGLFKKTVIADNIAMVVDPLFNQIGSLSTFDAWAAAILYTFQIYFDFSAYSEMAYGLALLLNVRIPFNFNSPYKALSIIDFWRRWHIPLSRFLRDYLYIQLGGNRQGPIRRYLNLLATMLLGGLWHGASWTFVIWGGLHGTYLVINHAWQARKLSLPRPVAWMVTFLAVVIAWVFFRVQSCADAALIFKAMFGLNHAYQLPSNLTMSPLLMMGCVVALISLATLAPNTQQFIISRQPRFRVTIPAMIMLLLGIFGMGLNYNFIYFQF